MKGNNIIMSLLVFACFVMYLIIELKLPCKDGEKECSVNTKRLEAKRDSLNQKNLILDEKYHILESKADSLQEKLSSTKQTIVQLKNKQHEKVNVIDNLNSGELYEFFSKFNPESSDTK